MYEFQVEKMNCGGCASRVTKAVQLVDGSAKVDIDLGSKTVRVSTQADQNSIQKAITVAGYPATVRNPV